jgi:hypothetical protein
MAGLVPAIHVLAIEQKSWMRGSSPRMTQSTPYAALLCVVHGRSSEARPISCPCR